MLSMPFFCFWQIGMLGGYRSSSNSHEDSWFVFFLGTLEIVTRVAIQLGDFGASNCFLFGFHSSKNKCAHREYFQTIHDVLENLSFDFVTCSLGFLVHMCNTCVQRCIMVTRLALYYDCDHEHFMTFKNALFLNNIPERFRKNLGAPCRRALGRIPPSFHSCLKTQELVSSTTLSMKYFPRPR